MTIRRAYGWQRSHGDIRDQFHYPKVLDTSKLPAATDFSHAMPPVYDQGALGSCTANALGAAFEFALDKHDEDFMPSRLWLYYQERAKEGTIKSDAGAIIRDGAKVLSHMGCPPEAMWPYKVSKFATRPPAIATRSALDHRVTSYARVNQTSADLMSTLAEGLPIVFGFTVYESFESEAVADSGIVPMPGSDESTVGGHAVVLVGYDRSAKTYLVRNSWGADWGQAGYFTMPFAYVENATLCDDFWILKDVE